MGWVVRDSSRSPISVGFRKIFWENSIKLLKAQAIIIEGLIFLSSFNLPPLVSLVVECNARKVDDMVNNYLSNFIEINIAVDKFVHWQSE